MHVEKLPDDRLPWIFACFAADQRLYRVGTSAHPTKPGKIRDHNKKARVIADAGFCSISETQIALANCAAIPV